MDQFESGACLGQPPNEDSSHPALTLSSLGDHRLAKQAAKEWREPWGRQTWVQAIGRSGRGR
jgi:hypothetical protein